jgi:predicted DNA-binding transcriptional regulator AlpA
MGNDLNDRWLSRQELADRYGLPVKTIAQWASKGTGPLYARMGRHVRYRLSDVVDWESARIDDLREATHPAATMHHEFEPVAPTVTRDANQDSLGNVR